MGLLATISDALGLARPITPREAGPVVLTPEAIRRVRALPEGTALYVTTAPAERGRLVRFREGPEPTDPDTPRHGTVVVDPNDEQRLRGLVIDHDGTRWRIDAPLQVRGGETPNPDGRLYTTSRIWIDGPPRWFTAGEPAPPLAARLLGLDGVRSVMFRAHTVTVEREPGASWRALDKAVAAELREHLLTCGEPLAREDRPEAEDDLEAEVLAVLEARVLPRIHRDGGDLELLGVSPDGVVRVRMVGACHGCPASALTLKVGIERALKEAFPGRVREVVAV